MVRISYFSNQRVYQLHQKVSRKSWFTTHGTCSLSQCKFRNPSLSFSATYDFSEPNGLYESANDVASASYGIKIRPATSWTGSSHFGNRWTSKMFCVSTSGALPTERSFYARRLD